MDLRFTGIVLFLVGSVLFWVGSVGSGLLFLHRFLLRRNLKKKAQDLPGPSKCSAQKCAALSYSSPPNTLPLYDSSYDHNYGYLPLPTPPHNIRSSKEHPTIKSLLSNPPPEHFFSPRPYSSHHEVPKPSDTKDGFERIERPVLAWNFFHAPRPYSSHHELPKPSDTKDGFARIEESVLGWNFFLPPRPYSSPPSSLPKPSDTTMLDLYELAADNETKRIEAMGSLPFQDQFNGFYRPDSCSTIDTGYVPGRFSGHLSSVTAAKKLQEIGQTDTSITGCDSGHVIGMVEPMDRPLVSNGEKLGQPGLFTSSPLEDLHQKSLNYTETQWRDDCGPPAPHSSENDLLESSGPKDRSNWYKEIFMNVAREMIHESEMRIGTLPVQDPSNGLSRQHQLSPMEPLPNNEGYLKDFLGSGISNAQFSGVQNGSLLDTAMNKSHVSGGAATPLTGVIPLI